LFLSPRKAAWHVTLFDELQRVGFIEGQGAIVQSDIEMALQTLCKRGPMRSSALVHCSITIV
jgi:hypothetical protein